MADCRDIAVGRWWVDDGWSGGQMMGGDSGQMMGGDSGSMMEGVVGMMSR